MLLFIKKSFNIQYSRQNEIGFINLAWSVDKIETEKWCYCSTTFRNHFRSFLNSQLASAKQSVVLLKQDKEYFSKQVSELHNKLIVADERVVQLNEQLERAKQAREELYEKYIVSRWGELKMYIWMVQ